MTHLYYGDGKGKTTAAIGLCVRAAGNEIPVMFVQFLKGRMVGEVKILENLGVTVLRGKSSGKFTLQMTQAERLETRKISDENLSLAICICKKILSHGKKVLLVLDEVCAALNENLLDSDLVKDLVCSREENLELVLTGRNPPGFLLENSDYITEMKKHKHPFDSGTVARIGIEF